jgi:hypothetical protein
VALLNPRVGGGGRSRTRKHNIASVGLFRPRHAPAGTFMVNKNGASCPCQLFLQSIQKVNQYASNG